MINGLECIQEENIKIAERNDFSDAIRGREQQLIDMHGGAKSQGGTSGNAINGISPNNPKAEHIKMHYSRSF